MDERMQNLVPMVLELTARGERAYDIYSRLLIFKQNRSAALAEWRQLAA